jgi:hypothetical protein
LDLALKEEEKIRTRKGYRTPAATLRKLARSPMIFELDKSREGDWDRFQIRKIGFKAQKQALGRLDKKSRREIIKLGTAD